MITILKYYSNEVRAVVNPSDASVQEKEVGGQNTVTLSFSYPIHIDFRVGDHCVIFSEQYYVSQRPVKIKTANREFEYTLYLEGEQHKLGRTRYFTYSSTNGLNEKTFFVNGKPLVFMQLLLENVNRLFPGDGWKLGFVLDAPERNIGFDNNNCLEVLNRLAEEFGTEWLIEGRTIHLYKRETNAGIVFKRGKNEALYSITSQPLDSSNPVTRLYAYGSSKNLGSSYRNGAQALRMGDETYIERLVDQFGLWEGTQVFEDIYPRRVGKVSGVGTPFVFAADLIDFNVNNYLLAGIKAKVVFNSGQLAGYTFEVSTYDHSSRTLTINSNTDEQTLDIPNEDLRPAVGDEYVLFDIRMPQSYIDAAEQELRQAASAWLDENGVTRVVYTVAVNPLWFKRNSHSIRLTASVFIQDEDLEIYETKRITGFSRNVRYGYQYNITLADKTRERTIVRIINTLYANNDGRR